MTKEEELYQRALDIIEEGLKCKEIPLGYEAAARLMMHPIISIFIQRKEEAAQWADMVYENGTDDNGSEEQET